MNWDGNNMGIEKLIKKQPFKNKSIIISGGSKGIGKETAKLIARLGGNVCIIARDMDALNETANEIKNIIQGKDQFVEIISCDLTDMDKLKPLLTSFIEKHGVPDYLINNVGFAYPQYVEELTVDDYHDAMNVNFFGQLHPTMILLPYFMEAKKGHICNVSSFLGIMGMMGYAAYTPSKYAIAGWSEVLRNELKPHNIMVSVLYPMEPQTPGFDKENEAKPEECAIMSESGGINTAEEVAETWVKGILKNKFQVIPGKGKWISRIKRLLPGVVYSSIDGDYKKAREKLGK